MPWQRLKLRVDQPQVDALTEALEEAGATSITLTDAGDEPLFETEWDKVPLWSQVQLTALFPAETDIAAVVRDLTQTLTLPVALAYATDLLGDDDWATAWKANYRPLEVGRGLWVCPSWCQPPEPTAVNIILDPGMAFGTGTHPTTALCLEWLSQQDLRGKVVLDYGCGSGILAIAALKLGALRAIATDIDAMSLEVTRENARRNGVAASLETALPADLSPATSADIVVANILAGALIDLADTLIGRLKPGGAIALSGVLGTQTDEVSERYAPAVPLKIRQRDEWALLTGQRRIEHS
jgi:ribosomal protein L11 methyltransferase